METELITLKTEDGVVNDGYIIKNNSKKIVISIHGMTSNCFKKRDKIISNLLVKNKFSYMGFNNRGSEIVKFIKKEIDGVEKSIIAGTSIEDPRDGYYDIKSAVLKAIEYGYEDIYLQGHSLGSTKIVYFYNKLKEEDSELLNYIKGIVLLSLIDIPRAIKVYLNENFQDMLELANQKVLEKEYLAIMPKECFIYPISAKTFLIYARDNEDINFAQYNNEKFEFKELNNIKVPIFMRWGTSHELIEQQPEKLVKMMNNKIKNNKKNINYVKDANHNYVGKEEILAKQINDFLINI